MEKVHNVNKLEENQSFLRKNLLTDVMEMRKINFKEALTQVLYDIQNIVKNNKDIRIASVQLIEQLNSLLEEQKDDIIVNWKKIVKILETLKYAAGLFNLPNLYLLCLIATILLLLSTNQEDKQQEGTLLLELVYVMGLRNSPQIVKNMLKRMQTLQTHKQKLDLISSYFQRTNNLSKL